MPLTLTFGRKMTYAQFKEMIRAELQKNSHGKTWKELQRDLSLPYTRPCPEWTKTLEKEIGLVREKGQGRELIWSIRTRHV
jgi:hypothetical protein